MRIQNKLLACAMALVVPLCTWAQTEIEPNNSSGQATALTYNTAMAGSIGACAPTDNTDDYFSFTPPSQGQLRVQSSISNTGATDLEVTFRVRQSSTAIIGTFTLTAGANGVPVNDSFLFPCQGSGLYYISIENPAGGACTNYSFTYDIVAPVFADDAEPNDGSGNAVTVPVGVWQQGQIDFRYGNNSDYYRIDLPTHGVLNIEWEAEHAGTTSPATAELVLRQTSTAAVQTWNLPVGANSTPATQSVSIDCRSNTNYYFLSLSTGICGTSYRFRYSVTPPLFANDAEPNDGSGSATVLAHSTPTEGQINFSTYANNLDYYRIDLPTQGILNIQWEAENVGPNGTGTVQAVLRQSSTAAVTTWNLPVGANSVASSQTVSIDCRSNTGFYYLSLESDICGVSYRFSYTVTPPIFNNDVEPNNSSGSATTIPHSTSTQGQINFSTYVENSDYYRLDLPTSGILNIQWEGEHASATPGTATLTLRQTSTAFLQSWTVPVGASSIPVSQTVSINCRGNQNFYYLQVEGVSCGISYELSYTVTPPIYDFNPATGVSSGGATTIDLEAATVEGQVGFFYGQASAYYRIDHTGGPIVLDFLAEHAGAAAENYTVRLRSSSTAQLAFVDLSAGGNSTPLAGQADFGTRAAGLYYIEVENTPCGMSYAIQCNDADGDGVCNTGDLCANTPIGEGVNNNGCSCSQVIVDDGDVCTLDACLNGNVTNTFQDADNDLTCDANDGCPNDPNKIAAGICGCGVSDADTDGDGTVDCNDGCPSDPNKIAAGICGCGVSDVDSDGDATADCNDGCPNDPAKIAAGICGCGVADADSDGDGTADCVDPCPNLANLINGDPCDDLNPNTTGDVVTNCICAGTLLGDDCEGVPGGPAQPGTACDDADPCTANDIYDPNCVCAGTSVDTDGDGTADCDDGCPLDPAKIVPGACGCGVSDADTDGDGTADCNDLCPNDPLKIAPGDCGCGIADTDTDADGTADCNDGCPTDPNKIAPGTCGCGVADTDTDGDGAADCVDACPALANVEPGDPCDDGDPLTVGDEYNVNCVCAGTPVSCTVAGDCDDQDPCTTDDCVANACVYTPVADTDGDGTCDAIDGCPADANKIAPGICGCGNPEPGTTCDDGNAGTVGDQINANCLCEGTPLGEDCLGVPGGSALPGTACDDGDPLTGDDEWDANCACVGLPYDCLNVPGGTAVIGSACDDANACTTGDVYDANCVCTGTFQDADADGVCDANDNCPNVPGQIGSACDDDNENTEGDVLNALCQCQGTPIGGCTEDLTLSITLDGNPGETTWILYDANESGVILSGGPYGAGQANTTVTEALCVPVGCYHLEVSDSGNNGITGGGYVLRDENNKRIIDATMGSFTGTSEIGGTARTFCVPLSVLNLLSNTCDQSAKLIQSPIYCNSQPGSTGIQWWIYNPHGTYNRRVTTASNVLIPGNLNSSPVPTNTWLNVRVRPVFSGGPGEFGPACRIRFIPNSGGGGREILFDEGTSVTMSLYPNPNRDGLVTLSMEGVDVADETMVDVDIYDMLGKRVFTERAIAAEGIVNHRMELGREIGTGLYMVNVTIEGKLYTQRLVIQ